MYCAKLKEAIFYWIEMNSHVESRRASSNGLKHLLDVLHHGRRLIAPVPGGDKVDGHPAVVDPGHVVLLLVHLPRLSAGRQQQGGGGCLVPAAARFLQGLDGSCI